jgi:hypothetical protein
MSGPLQAFVLTMTVPSYTTGNFKPPSGEVWLMTSSYSNGGASVQLSINSSIGGVSVSFNYGEITPKIALDVTRCWFSVQTFDSSVTVSVKGLKFPTTTFRQAIGAVQILGGASTSIRPPAGKVYRIKSHLMNDSNVAYWASYAGSAQAALLKSLGQGASYTAQDLVITNSLWITAVSTTGTFNAFFNALEFSDTEIVPLAIAQAVMTNTEYTFNIPDDETWQIFYHSGSITAALMYGSSLPATALLGLVTLTGGSNASVTFSILGGGSAHLIVMGMKLR